MVVPDNAANGLVEVWFELDGVSAETHEIAEERGLTGAKAEREQEEEQEKAAHRGAAEYSEH
jgi:hypothetical protein